jgi:predicted  nucleic acid-binding Zn-ribbon protein
LRPEQFDLNTSSIDKPSEFEELNQALDEKAAQVKSLENELAKFKSKNTNLEKQKDSLLSEVKESRESSSATQIEQKASAELQD